MVSQQLIAWQKRDETELLYINVGAAGCSTEVSDGALTVAVGVF